MHRIMVSLWLSFRLQGVGEQDKGREGSRPLSCSMRVGYSAAISSASLPVASTFGVLPIRPGGAEGIRAVLGYREAHEHQLQP
jgi:hypothetical protein